MSDLMNYDCGDPVCGKRAREASAEIERLRQETETLTAWALEERGKVEWFAAALREIAHVLDHRDAPPEIGRIARAALERSDEALFPTKKICPECGQRMREGDYCDHIPF